MARLFLFLVCFLKVEKRKILCRANGVQSAVFGSLHGCCSSFGLFLPMARLFLFLLGGKQAVLDLIGFQGQIADAGDEVEDVLAGG